MSSIWKTSLGRAGAAGALSLAWLALAAGAWAEPDSERLRAAKTLTFDGKYAEARSEWQAALAASRGAEADAAAYWIARCSEKLGEAERAFREYGDFLARRPSDPTLTEEAKTSRVGLAARLYKAGRQEHVAALREALLDPSKTVRYYAALQAAGLGGEAARAAVPVLESIVREEKDQDLADRAKLALWKVDPKALSRATPPRGPEPRRAEPPRREASWLRVRIFEKGSSKPQVSINLPMGLAELAYKSLPDDARRDLKKEGYDAETFWERLKKLGPTEILTIEGGDGERIQVWIE
jgi:hypothetical protein